MKVPKSIFFLSVLICMSGIIYSQDIMKDSVKNNVTENIYDPNTISHHDFNKGVKSNLLLSIRGKVPGVSIFKQGSDPSESAGILIRGGSSLYFSNDPLYVIDGIPNLDYKTIPIDDVKEIEILSDAASTAIYGNQGANGVVLISTEGNDFNKGIQTEFSSSFYFDKVSNPLNLFNADEYKDYIEDINPFFQDGGADTDWQDLIYRNAFSHIYHLSVAGGYDNISFRISGNYNRTTGTLIDNDLLKKSTTAHFNYKGINDKLNINTSFSYYSGKSNYIEYNDINENILYQAFIRNPTDPLYEDDGETYHTSYRFFGLIHPLLLSDRFIRLRKNRDARVNLKLSYLISKDLEISILGAYNVNSEINEQTDMPVYYDEFESYFTGKTLNNYTFINPNLKYKKKINNKHDILIYTGYQYRNYVNETGFESFSFETIDGIRVSNDMLFADGNVEEIKNNNSALYGSFTYNYNNYFELTGSYRLDANYSFEKQNINQYQSVEGKMNIKNMLLKNTFHINQFNIRGSYGKSGNNAYSLYYNNADSTQHIYPELITEISFGFDIALFNRFYTSLRYFNKKHDDLIIPFPLPVPPYIYPYVIKNSAQMNTNGISLNSSVTLFSVKNIDWSINLNFSAFQTTIDNLDKDNPSNEIELQSSYIDYLYADGWTRQISNNISPYNFYLYEFAEIIDGEFAYTTADGNISRFPEYEDKKVLGNAMPDFEIFLTNKFTLFNQIDLEFMIRYVHGHSKYNATYMLLSSPSAFGANRLEDVYDITDSGVSFMPQHVNDFYLQDASFLRMEYLSLSYKMKLKEINMNFFLNFSNLFTLTKYKGIDPDINIRENNSGIDFFNVYQKNRTVNFGIKINI